MTQAPLPPKPKGLAYLSEGMPSDSERFPGKGMSKKHAQDLAMKGEEATSSDGIPYRQDPLRARSLARRFWHPPSPMGIRSSRLRFLREVPGFHSPQAR